MNRVCELFEFQIANFKAVADTAKNPEIRDFAERTYNHLKLEYEYYLKSLAELEEEAEEREIIMDEEPAYDYGYSLSDLSEEDINKMLESYFAEMQDLEEQLNGELDYCGR